MTGNTFSNESVTYGAYQQPVWLDVQERKTGGCTLTTTNIPVGTIICAGSPVYMAKMGGDGVVLDAFEVSAAVTTTGTSVTLKQGICGTMPQVGMILGKADGDGDVALAGALGASTDGLTFTITANALGALSVGDFLYVATEAGSDKAMQMPTGLMWHEGYVRTGTFGATAAVVTKGQLLADRVPVLHDAYKASLGKTGITFEYEL